MNSSIKKFVVRVSCVVAMLGSGASLAFNMPETNSYLAKSNNSMGHGDSAQQDAVPQAGPSGPSRSLRANEIQYTFTGPAFFGINTSGLYNDGKRVMWGNGLDRIVKLDYDTQVAITEYYFPGAQRWTEEYAEDTIAYFNEDNDSIFAIYRTFQEMMKLRNLSNLYTVLDKDHIYYVGSKSGLITAYGDVDPSDSRSAIVKLREFQLPAEATGPIMGLNMTYDGWLIAATEHGYIIT